MIVTIHQPEFMPYGGFFAKALRSDKLVLLDTVQYKKNYFENRNRVLVGGEPKFITVPVHHKDRLSSTIADMTIGGDARWGRKIVETLRTNYRHHPYFGEVFPFFEELFSREHERLAPLNVAMIRWLAERLGVGAELILASEHQVEGHQSELLANWTHHLGGDVYLSGPLGRNYLEREPFDQRGVAIRIHDFHAQPYPQPGRETFEPNLSVFDLLCCCSPGEARANLLAGSTVSEE